MGAVEDRLVDGLLFLENNKPLVHSMTGFDWIISIIYIANWYQNFISGRPVNYK
jgi:hypothetical protein